jgi:hypothetical protein
VGAPTIVTVHPAPGVARPRRAHRRLLDDEVTGVSTTGGRATHWATVGVKELTGVAGRR